MARKEERAMGTVTQVAIDKRNQHVQLSSCASDVTIIKTALAKGRVVLAFVSGKWQAVDDVREVWQCGTQVHLVVQPVSESTSSWRKLFEYRIAEVD